MAAVVRSGVCWSRRVDVFCSGSVTPRSVGQPSTQGTPLPCRCRSSRPPRILGAGRSGLGVSHAWLERVRLG